MSKLEEPKSMEMFFVDNRATYTREAQLAGDLVLAPDEGVYPRAIPVAGASHPSFDGKIVVMAGNRTLLVAMVHGARSEKDCQKIMSAMPKSAKEGKVQQYSIGLDSIIHRVVMHTYEKQEGHERRDVPLGKLFEALAAEHTAEAGQIADALDHMIRYGKGEKGLTPATWESMSDTSAMIHAALATAKAEADE